MRSKFPPLCALLLLACCDRQTSSGPTASPAKGPGNDAPDQSSPTAVTDPVPPPSPSAHLEYEQNSVDVFRAVAPATVFVTQTRVVRDRWTLRALEVPSGSGTGFVWDKKGHIVTNYHVIDKARSLTVTLVDGVDYPARLVGGDPRKDIAVLAIEAPEEILIPVRLAPEGTVVDVGQKALAIGNPFGLDHTLTVGVISATGREVMGFGGLPIRDMLQTDAAINPGNSGGPLLDAHGQLIGMNTMIYSKTGGSQGVGFAVPLSTIRRVVPQIIEHGKPLRAGLGIDAVADEVARFNRVKGVVVAAVRRNSAAARAGIRGLQRTRTGVLLGDVIVGIDDEKVVDLNSFYIALDDYQPGDKVVVHIVRDGKKMQVPVTLMALD